MRGFLAVFLAGMRRCRRTECWSHRGRDFAGGRAMSMGTGGDRRDELAKSIFLDALEIASTRDRTAYLDRRCGPDGHLRAEVEALLRHREQLGDYLARPALDP